MEVGCTPYETCAELENPSVTILRASRRELTFRKTRLELELEEVEREGGGRGAPALAVVWVEWRVQIARKLAAAQHQVCPEP